MVAGQITIAFQLVHGVAQAGLRIRQDSGSLISCSGQQFRIDQEQGRAFFYLLAFLIQTLGDNACHPRPDFCLAVGFQSARGGNYEWGGGDIGNMYFDFRQCSFIVVAGLLLTASSQDDEKYGKRQKHFVGSEK